MAAREDTFTTGCNMNCGGGCLLKVHVSDGVIRRIETDDGEEPQLRACVRCRAYRQRVYAPDRLLYPLKRTGERGQGKFKRISWDEALERIAAEYRRIKQRYGPAAVACMWCGGDFGRLHVASPISRAFYMAGGCTVGWGSHSCGGGTFAGLATYGIPFQEIGNGMDDLVNSKLVILWGINPADTMQGNGTAMAMVRAREAGTKFVVVEPRFTSTAAVLADRWIPIRPGSDTAVMLAMAYVIITENLHDQRFLDTYTVGFERLKEYLLGEEDSLPKTPSWAEPISGIPAQTTAELAREYANAKPAALLTGWALGRTAMGEQSLRMAYVLTAMTGNIGIHGGSPGAACSGAASWRPGRISGPAWGMETGGNPAEAGSAKRPHTLKGFGEAELVVRPNKGRVADAILKGKAGGYPSDLKMLYLLHYNWLGQLANVNKHVQALKSLEFIAVQDQFMTATARFGDIVLPTSTFLERNDLTTGAGPHVALMRKVIEPVGESRSPLDIAVGLAEKLGIADFNDKTEEEWLREMMGSVAPDYQYFMKSGVHKFRLAEPFVLFKAQIEDPADNPFPTPSGKIEIYSQQLADMNNPLIPPVPKHIETWEGRNDPLTKKYPLQLITTHPKLRAHSQFGNIPWLKELEPQAVMISTADAEARGIRNGDPVRVFNDRGEIIIPAKVSERIVPGVVDVPQGAWYDPDERGVDRGGCANVLTRDDLSPGGAMAFNTALVQVERTNQCRV